MKTSTSLFAYVQLYVSVIAALLFFSTMFFAVNLTTANLRVLALGIVVVLCYYIGRFLKSITMQYYLVAATPFLLLVVAVVNMVLLQTLGTFSWWEEENVTILLLAVYMLIILNLFIGGSLAQSNTIKNVFFGAILLTLMYSSVRLSYTIAKIPDQNNFGIYVFGIYLIIFLITAVCIVYWSGWLKRHWKEILLPDKTSKLSKNLLNGVANCISLEEDEIVVSEHINRHFDFSIKSSENVFIDVFIPAFIANNNRQLAISVARLFVNYLDIDRFEKLPRNIWNETLDNCNNITLLMNIKDKFASSDTGPTSVSFKALEMIAKLMLQTDAEKKAATSASISPQWFISIISTQSFDKQFRIFSTEILYTHFNTFTIDTKCSSFISTEAVPFFISQSKHGLACKVILSTGQFYLLGKNDLIAIINHLNIIEFFIKVIEFKPSLHSTTTMIMNNNEWLLVKSEAVFRLLKLAPHYKRQSYYTENIISFIVQNLMENGKLHINDRVILCEFLYQYFGIENKKHLFAGKNIASRLINVSKDNFRVVTEDKIWYLASNLWCISPDVKAIPFLEQAWIQIFAHKVAINNRWVESTNSYSNIDNNTLIIAGSILRAMAACAAINPELEYKISRIQIDNFLSPLLQKITLAVSDINSLKIEYASHSLNNDWTKWVTAYMKWMDDILIDYNFSDDILKYIAFESSKNIEQFNMSHLLNLHLPDKDVDKFNKVKAFAAWLQNFLDECLKKADTFKDKDIEMVSPSSVVNILMEVASNTMIYSLYIRQNAMMGLHLIFKTALLDTSTKTQIKDIITQSMGRRSLNEYFYEVRLFSNSSIAELAYFIRLALTELETNNYSQEYNDVPDALLKFEEEFLDIIKFLESYPLEITTLSPLETRLGYYVERGYDPIWWTRYIPNSYFDNIGNLRSRYNLGEVIERYIEITDFTRPNAMGIANICFKNSLLLLPTLFHEFKHYRGEKREVPVWIMEHLYTRHLITKYAPSANEPIARKNYWKEIKETFSHVSNLNLHFTYASLLFAVLGHAGKFLYLSDMELFEQITQTVEKVYKPPLLKGSIALMSKTKSAIEQINNQTLFFNNSEEVLSWCPNKPFPILNSKQEIQLEKIIEKKFSINNLINYDEFTALMAIEPYVTWNKEWKEFCADVS